MEKKIITSPTYSPLPNRKYDWCAYYEGEEEEGIVGYGATKEEAVEDLKSLD